ncbi:hypothetical protein ILUMI_17373 [Ignelater luminosus]|uniref:Uncharacterized protein n=1 Tax=Ignelater luminosus TaxID=2038154 RepID=A0A8K0CK84_IGNLU|nr:hypothetical protein ILUMI_17373 [Ignelater luminosus]
MNSKIILAFLVAFALANFGSCLQCYQCSTEEHGEACKYPKENNVDVTECPWNKVCYTRFDIFTTSNITFERGCSSLRECIPFPIPRPAATGCQACGYELCNTWNNSPASNKSTA